MQTVCTTPKTESKIRPGSTSDNMWSEGIKKSYHQYLRRNLCQHDHQVVRLRTRSVVQKTYVKGIIPQVTKPIKIQ